MKLSFKTFCACLALLYAGDVVATDSDLSSYNEERGRSNVEVRNKTKSKSLFRSRSSSRDRSVRGEKSVVYSFQYVLAN